MLLWIFRLKTCYHVIVLRQILTDVQMTPHKKYVGTCYVFHLLFVFVLSPSWAAVVLS